MTPDEKLEILRTVEKSSLPVNESLVRLDVPSSTYYRWKANFARHGVEGLQDRSPFKGSDLERASPTRGKEDSRGR